MAPYAPTDGITKLVIDQSKHFTEALKEALKSSADQQKVAAEKVSELVAGDANLNLGVVAQELRNALTGNDADSKVVAAYIVDDLMQKHAERVEAYFVPLLSVFLDLLADKKPAVRPVAQEAALTIISSANKNSTIRILPILFDGLDRSKKWQTKKGSLDLVAELSKVAPYQVSRCLPEIIPVVTDCMWDTRKEVKVAAKETMTKVCNVVGNMDIEPFIPALVSCLANPTEVPECTHKLASTTFVKTVEAPALAIMEPLLKRALAEGKTAVKRQAAVIIDNMCKLMDDPAEAQLFIPKLLPGLKKVIETQADPECREVATRAHETLFVAGGSMEVSEDELKVDYANIHNVVVESIAANAAAVKANIDSFTVDYVTGICYFLVVARNFNKAVFEKEITTYFKAFMKPEDIKPLANEIRDRCFKENKSIFIEDVDCDEGIPDLCNCEFSLAYGGMILLNNARLRLKRGHRYGLCGPNGCGKSTLMRAISNGQLEGFPSRDELKTVFVEHNLQASEAELSVVDFILNDEDLKNTPREEVQDTLASVGFTPEMQAQGVGTLSGGWKMKLELARAMLQKADILLLDEPTNHLDVKNVAWLENYLTSLPNVTSIMVSHDSGFLDKVCTNIIHYETRKLKIYKGNLSKFVEQKPEAKAYYELESENVKFTFPEPGFLADIKNKGKPIIRLTNCSYQYPGAPKPSINNISVTCALSSRIAVLGPNGAGKSTMIKMLTGEVEPTSGQVWKHPAMRFAYVAQHAFHHIESHLDETANQYIQWRFQSGEDKELLAKETRKLTPEEKEARQSPSQEPASADEIMAMCWHETLAPWLVAIQSKFKLQLPSLLPTRSELRDAVVVCEMTELRRDEAMCCVMLEAMELLNLLAHLDAACAWKMLCDACDEPRAVHRLGLSVDVVTGIMPTYAIVITYDDWDNSNTMGEAIDRLVDGIPDWSHSPAFWSVKKRLLKMLPRGTAIQAVGVAFWLRFDNSTVPYEYQLDCLEDACALNALLKDARVQRDPTLPFYATSCSIDFGAIPIRDIETALLVSAALTFFVTSVKFGGFKSEALFNYSQLEFSYNILNMWFIQKPTYETGIHTLHLVPSTLCNDWLDIECVYIGVSRSGTLEVLTFDDRYLARRTAFIPEGECESNAEDTRSYADASAQDDAYAVMSPSCHANQYAGANDQSDADNADDTTVRDPEELGLYWIEGIVAAVFHGCGKNHIRHVALTLQYSTLEDIHHIREKLEYAVRYNGIEPLQWHIDELDTSEEPDDSSDEFEKGKEARQRLSDSSKVSTKDVNNAAIPSLLPPEPLRRYSTHYVRHLSLSISGDTTVAFVSALLWIGGEPLTRLDLHGPAVQPSADHTLNESNLQDILNACRKLRCITLESFKVESLAPLTDPSFCPRSLESLVITDSLIQDRESIQQLFQALCLPTHSLYLTLRDLCIRQDHVIDINTSFYALKMLQINRHICRFMIGGANEPLIARLHDVFDRYNGRPVVHESLPVESKLTMVYVLKRTMQSPLSPVIARACLSSIYEFAALRRTRNCALVLS